MAAEASRSHVGDLDVVGTFHYFGEHGPAYEVLGVQDREFVEIRVVETGETLSYPIANVRADPEA
ncbi:DUF5397 family protein [uncultured Enterovirga sp.]|uniref:DUF5397 family protein n=1 Tax=uncultured Enterovirga sp. TaxID=2026352 RepID=UPI0035CB18CA